MAKKKKQEYSAPVMTRGQISRAQREQQQIRNLYTVGIALGTVVLLILGFAVIYTFVVQPNTEVAKVNNVTINRAEYNKLRRWALFQQIQQEAITQQVSQQATGAGGTTLDVLRQQLRDVESENPLDQDTIKAMVDSEVLRQKSAQDFQVNPSTEDLKKAAYKDFEPQPTAPPSDETPTVVSSSPTVAGAVTGTVTITPTATRTATPGSPTLTPTSTATFPPVAGAQQTAEAVYSRYISAIDNGAEGGSDTLCTYGCPDLSEEDYLHLILEPRVRREQVIEKITAGKVMTEVEQIHAQHILTTTEDGATQIIARLDKGEDFTTVANEQSSEQIDRIKQGAQPNGGDLGWFPREGSNLVTEFVEGAWPVQAGKYSQPVQTTFGWHVIKVIERDPKRALDQSQIEAQKQKLYDDWFAQAKLSSQISPTFAQQPTPTIPPLVEPTPAGGAVAPTVAAGTPGASPPTTDTNTTGGEAASPTASGTLTGTISPSVETTATVPAAGATPSGSATP
jgi:parvulin-like peptidyl-prolyl isomerase